MKLLPLVAVALFTVSGAQAQDSLKTETVEKWGYVKDHLVLILHDGKQVLVEPKQCSLSEFNAKMTSTEKLDLRLTSSHVRPNVPFSVTGRDEEGTSRLKCRVNRLSLG